MRFGLLLLALGSGCTGSAKPDTGGMDSAPGETAETADSVDTGESVDADGDGYPADVDCDDADPAIYPGQTEVCDGVDQDCDGLIDEDASDASTWYADLDGDGYGDPSAPVLACDLPTDAVADATDCDDTAFSTNPNAEEICDDGADNNCDGGAGDCRLAGAVEADGGLALPGDAAGDRAGSAVAGPGDLSGDGLRDLAVGSPGADGGGLSAGAVQIWFGPLVAGGSLAHATLEGTADGEAAGTALAGAGDLDGDGLADLLVGAPGAAGAGTDAGAVYVVSLPTDGSLADTAARLDGFAARDSAGSAVAGLGDLDGDGWGEVAVGAPGASGTGEVYLAVGPITGVTALGEHAVAGVLAGDELGAAVAAGDLDGDGLTDLVVGAPGDDSVGSDAGAIYVFTDPLGAKLAADAAGIRRGGASGDGAGGAVAVVGDTDGDGYGDLAVGAPYASGSGAYAGCAFLVRGPVSGEGSLLDAAALILGASDGETAGASLAGPGDVDGDGEADLLIGLPWGDYLAVNGGGAALFYGPVEGTMESADAGAVLAGSAGLERAGTAVAGAGEVNGDGVPDLLVGAPYLRGAGSDSGVAWLVAGGGL